MAEDRHAQMLLSASELLSDTTADCVWVERDGDNVRVRAFGDGGVRVDAVYGPIADVPGFTVEEERSETEGAEPEPAKRLDDDFVHFVYIAGLLAGALSPLYSQASGAAMISGVCLGLLIGGRRG